MLMGKIFLQELGKALSGFKQHNSVKKQKVVGPLELVALSFNWEAADSWGSYKLSKLQSKLQVQAGRLQPIHNYYL